MCGPPSPLDQLDPNTTVLTFDVAATAVASSAHKPARETNDLCHNDERVTGLTFLGGRLPPH